ncbi:MULTISPECIES: TraE/TraK family type IV conjugative transfer system protein [Erwinia]|uniref:Type IV conjugative transfer system protein TraE n=1 Tax=Erwinia persicina TaxID=55211 RepID=A0ABR9A011_9GAMM|nr:TraE/TraK family type IV conjugative transfer system protein [Erwinia persicina]KMV67593.1 conjugal transfer protein [bacteria symbiont BFo1 of Frankliniella occidentalis]PIJ49691.1 conjugal transfer protein [Erwinia sp. OLMDLW33]KYP82422.1 conjugal transfer protein [bacteria symbiont BFo1 of Frankliniella occidentalis]MBD8109218.1 type IV conjugative transfer system protein TraE [Erwinia persicina]MBD8212342.1 type IV conjugative transfer system protein TraE [Erwinia persicina]
MKFQVKETRNRVVVVMLMSLTSLLALSIAGNCITGSLAWHFWRTQKTITTPMMFDRAFTSTSAEGDAALNSMMVRSLINLRLSVTPETVDGQHAALLRWVPSEDRPEMKKALAAEAEYVKKNGVSTVFRIDDETTDTGNGDITVRGVLSASTSNGSVLLPLPDVNKSYRLSVGYVDGLLRLTAFPEVPWTPVSDKTNRE